MSILLPSHNASKTIGLALLSTIFFKPKGSEVLVLLDGDNTASWLLSLFSRKKDVRVFRTKTALGISGALNFLLQESRFDLLARMDADDVCLPGRFKKAMREIQLNGVDFVFSHMIFFGSSVKPFGLLPQFPVRLNPEEAKWMLWLDNPFCHPTMVAKKSSVADLGGYQKTIYEDLDLWLRAQAADYKFKRLSRYGILYRRHAGQHTQKMFPDLETMESHELLLAAKRDLETYLRSQPGVPQNVNLDVWANQVLSDSNLGYRFQVWLSRRKGEAFKV